MKDLLNNGPYYNRTTGDCYTGRDNQISACDFSSTGLTSEAKKMIDTVTWNTGSNGASSYTQINSNLFYNLERSSNTGLWGVGDECSVENNRATSWVGQVGLMYVSDCKENDWIYFLGGTSLWTLNPLAAENFENMVFQISFRGTGLNGSTVSSSVSYSISSTLYPVVYLKSNINIVSGNGTMDSPYELSF